MSSFEDCLIYNSYCGDQNFLIEDIYRNEKLMFNNKQAESFSIESRLMLKEKMQRNRISFRQDQIDILETGIVRILTSVLSTFIFYIIEFERSHYPGIFNQLFIYIGINFHSFLNSRYLLERKIGKNFGFKRSKNSGIFIIILNIY
jgi:hypothetical protein